MKQEYYKEKLAADNLRRCYEIAPKRVKQYLEAEINYVLSKMDERFVVVELGCGYGRVLARLAERARFSVGIDTSYSSLSLCKETMQNFSNWALVNMNAVQTGLRGHSFDLVVCIQNGISAFHVDQHELIRESIRIAKTGGTILFSSYTDEFWHERLKWFLIQSNAGLLGTIDIQKTKDGIIVTKDGFTARTVRRRDFEVLVRGFDVDVYFTEIDDSSIFCEITVH